MIKQLIFDPTDSQYGFRWTDDWYTFDQKAASKAARKDRDLYAKRARAAGKRVTVFGLPSQLRTLGGIGSGHPQVSFVVNCYGLNVHD